MGFSAKAHYAGSTDVDLDRLAVLAGIVVRDGSAVVSPFVGRNFALAVVTTDYPIETDSPLAPQALKSAKGFRYRHGLSGAVSGLERARREKRASHLSQYPMEQVQRVDRPTTLILDEEVPRVPKRALFFRRAANGDLGAKAQREVKRFATKHPLAAGFMGPLVAMVPHQNGPVAERDPARYTDPAANARAIKSLAYHLGADLAGICEVPRYAWYSHRDDGAEVVPYHRYAVVMLIDQGFDTMEGASGDDWISGVQSMRAYMRGAEIAGMMADHLRGLGFSSRSQTNIDSDVLHIPLVLWAGLGELSRIGELVLNPFVGPRFKSVVFTTDMPLEVDKPIDFKLQYFCSNCFKCARECPCDAIPYGDKVMFNGYEIWKPDVERCTSYRLTNAGGAACGRCMKTCPLNKVVDRDGPILTRMASWCGVNAMWLKPFLVPIAVKLDDMLGHGRINKIKKWWLDLEMKDGVAIAPHRINRREIDPRKKVDPAKQKMAHYPASVMPPPVTDGPFPTDRKAALAHRLETVEEARRRHAAGGKPPCGLLPGALSETSHSRKVARIAMAKVSGGELFVRTLIKAGVKQLFGLHGAHLEALFQSCLDHGLPILDTRHEVGAGHAAEAYARSTNTLGVAMVTAGPGFTNCVTSIANAYMDRTPVLYIAGSSGLAQAETNTLQAGFDQFAVAKPITKWTIRIAVPEQIPRLVAEAIRIATSAPSGPVLLDMPSDVLNAQVDEEKVRMPETILVDSPPHRPPTP